jgi:hypothetical protein
LVQAVWRRQQRRQLVATDQTLYFRLSHQLAVVVAVDIQQFLRPDKMVALAAVVVGERKLAELELLGKETTAALVVAATLEVGAVERDRLVLLQHQQILEVEAALEWYLLLLVAECFMLAEVVVDQILAPLD